MLNGRGDGNVGNLGHSKVGVLQSYVVADKDVVEKGFVGSVNARPFKGVW